MDVRRATQPGEGTAEGQGWEIKDDICPRLQKLGKCGLFAVAHAELGREAEMEDVLDRARALCRLMEQEDAQRLLQASIGVWGRSWYLWDETCTKGRNPPPLQDLFAFRVPVGGMAACASSHLEECRSLASKLATWIDEDGGSLQDSDYWFQEEGLR